MLFWPEISALGVFSNFDNERMHPPKYLSDPPGEIFHLPVSTASSSKSVPTILATQDSFQRTAQKRLTSQLLDRN